VVRILDREQKTHDSVVCLHGIALPPFQWREAPEHVSFPVLNHSQSIYVIVVSVVKPLCFEALAAVRPQKIPVKAGQRLDPFEIAHSSAHKQKGQQWKISLGCDIQLVDSRLFSFALLFLANYSTSF
jgi:hypothetical protein